MKKISSLLILSIVPNIVLAASQDFGGFIDGLVKIINIIIPVLISLAIALFFFHTGKGIFGSAKNSGEAQTELKSTLFWGIIIIFVMVSIWGILNLLGGELNLMNQSPIGR